MRAVLDANILIAAVISPSGAPAQIVLRWLAGEFELVVSETLLVEVQRAFAYPKLRSRVKTTDVLAFVTLLRQGAIVAADPPATDRRSADPPDDYLLALAQTERAILVSGDRHLLALADELPIETPRAFLERLVAA